MWPFKCFTFPGTFFPGKKKLLQKWNSFKNFTNRSQLNNPFIISINPPLLPDACLAPPDTLAMIS